MRYKDIWCAEFERLYNEASASGPVSDRVYEYLGERARITVNEQLALASERSPDDGNV